MLCPFYGWFQHTNLTVHSISYCNIKINNILVFVIHKCSFGIYCSKQNCCNTFHANFRTICILDRRTSVFRLVKYIWSSEMENMNYFLAWGIAHDFSLWAISWKCLIIYFNLFYFGLNVFRPYILAPMWEIILYLETFL